MAAIGSPKPSVSRTSLFWQILFVVTLLLIARLLWTRTQPERLTTLSGDSYGADGYRVSGDYLYALDTRTFAEQSHSADPWWEPSIQIQSIHKPTRRTLVQNDPRYEHCQPYTLGLGDGNLYYAVVARSKSAFPHAGGGGMISLTPPLGAFLLQSQTPSISKIAGQTRTKLAPGPVQSMEIRFQQVSMRGGSPRDVAILRVAAFRLVGSDVYWIRPGVEETVRVIQSQTGRNQTSWLESNAHSDLMLTSLADGTTRCIRHGIAGFDSRSSSEYGITWRELAPYPEASKHFYARASDWIVHPLKLEPGQWVNLLPDVGGRVYWMTEGYDEASRRSYPNLLMSSKRDGADVREVLKQADPRLVFRGSLHSYRGGLYCLLDQSPLNPKDHRQLFLCRLHPDRSDPVEIVRKLPTEADYPQFDGGYLYFILKEQPRSLWATLTDDDVPSGDPTLTLCRFPLDH